MSTVLARPRPRPALPPAVPPALSPRRLIDLTRYYAAEVRSGRVGPVHYGDPTHPGDPDARWHVRVHSDERVDVWVISWLPTQGTQLHDHGGSAGAFTVLRGELTEAVWSPTARPATGSLRDRLHRAGTAVAFDPTRVHDVRNLGAEPALSVHAYSNPLTCMTFYDTSSGLLQPASVLDTTDPEPVS